MVPQIASILGTISFVIQKIIEFIRPLLESYIPWFNFSDIKVTEKKVSLLDKVYANTLHQTQAKDIKITKDGEDFTFSDEMMDVVKLRATLLQRVSNRKKSKSRRYMVLGMAIGVILCLIVSKLMGITFFSLADSYKNIQMSGAYWIIDSIVAGVLAGFGSKPVNDVLSYFNGSERKKTA
ncbi:hypothetical protein [Candidatus Uabimicrobium sp. HlEnr_7]|uniref:hypothetical protein n=1 Tax=Candidatus Uabimicrobium helgolandensis TaxID=3095367 RepID=UPI003556BF72